MYQYDLPSRWSKAVEIGTWVLLFIAIVPGSALAYFAENSLPTSPLYPVKRDIEAVVLKLVSLNSSTKSFYQLNLASTRVKEMGALLASADTPPTQVTQQFSVVSSQLEDTKNSINDVKDPVQQAQMRAQLQTTVIQYQQQLVTLNQQLTTTTNGGSSETQQTPSPTSPTAQPPSTDNTISSATPTPEVSAPPVSADFSTLTPQQKQDLENTIQQETEQLQKLQQDLQDNNPPQSDNGNGQEDNQQVKPHTNGELTPGQGDNTHSNGQ